MSRNPIYKNVEGQIWPYFNLLVGISIFFPSFKLNLDVPVKTIACSHFPRHTSFPASFFYFADRNVFSSKGSCRSWRKIVEVRRMMKERIFACHPFLALLPLTLPCHCLTCPCPTCPHPACLCPAPLTFALLTLVS